MKLRYFAAATALAALMAAPAWALPSSKATFTYAALNVVEEAFVACDTYDGTDCLALDLEDLATGSHSILQAQIKMPKW
jgi:hypothetical protein